MLVEFPPPRAALSSHRSTLAALIIHHRAGGRRPRRSRSPPRVRARGSPDAVFAPSLQKKHTARAVQAVRRGEGTAEERRGATLLQQPRGTVSDACFTVPRICSGRERRLRTLAGSTKCQAPGAQLGGVALGQWPLQHAQPAHGTLRAGTVQIGGHEGAINLKPAKQQAESSVLV